MVWALNCFYLSYWANYLLFYWLLFDCALLEINMKACVCTFHFFLTPAIASTNWNANWQKLSTCRLSRRFLMVFTIFIPINCIICILFYFYYSTMQHYFLCTFETAGAPIWIAQLISPLNQKSASAVGKSTAVVKLWKGSGDKLWKVVQSIV